MNDINLLDTDLGLQLNPVCALIAAAKDGGNYYLATELANGLVNDPVRGLTALTQCCIIGDRQKRFLNRQTTH